VTTSQTNRHVAEWLVANPAPIHASELPAWADRVQTELGPPALGDLMHLLEYGDLEQQYQAMAAARVLGVDVWADGREPDLTWLVSVPGEDEKRRIRPVQQLAD
jgi:hypothetical protein